MFEADHMDHCLKVQVHTHCLTYRPACTELCHWIEIIWISNIYGEQILMCRKIC